MNVTRQEVASIVRKTPYTALKGLIVILPLSQVEPILNLRLFCPWPVFEALRPLSGYSFRWF